MSKSVFSDKYRAFLTVLVTARRSAAVTQSELATRLGKPQSYVFKFESGERRIDFVELIDVVRALGANEIEFVAEVIKQPSFEQRG